MMIRHLPFIEKVLNTLKSVRFRSKIPAQGAIKRGWGILLGQYLEIDGRLGGSFFVDANSSILVPVSQTPGLSARNLVLQHDAETQVC